MRGARVAGLVVLSAAAAAVSPAGPNEATPPSELRSPSSVGEVVFPHALHAEDLGFACADCHHETNAAGLTMPHEDYFDDFWIDCQTCHHPSGEPAAPQTCSACHHDSPTTIADETLSAKVVVHKSCWGCHEGGTGAAAAAGCRFCHSGERSDL